MAAPLVPLWHAVTHDAIDAGGLHEVAVAVENAGSATWRTRGPEAGLFLSYHWLDERGNPIVWDGWRTALAGAIEPGATREQPIRVRAPIPPGPYRFAVDLVEEHRFWIAELGTEAWEESLDVSARDPSGARAFGASPDGAWLRAAAELHAEGW